MSHFSTTSVRKSRFPDFRLMKKSSLSLLNRIPVFENEGVYSTLSRSELFGSKREKDPPIFGITTSPCFEQLKINSVDVSLA